MAAGTILVTGALGEVGHGLLSFFAQEGGHKVIATDIRDLEETLPGDVEFVQGDVTGEALANTLTENYTFDAIFHLATIMSSGGEKNPQLAHAVNVEGSIHMMNVARKHSARSGKSVQFIFPSSCAAFGIRNADKTEVGRVLEHQFLEPITMYGINKLYVENLGRYYSEHYGTSNNENRIDFRCVRFPGLLSAETVPVSGTSDYGPEMLHYAAQGKPYSCFVKPETRIPFMAMPDAVRSLIEISRAPVEALTRRIYNISAFAPSAQEIATEVKKHFPEAEIEFESVPWRQALVDTWPTNMDDSFARNDWGWKARMDFRQTFREYLMPKVKERYA